MNAIRYKARLHGLPPELRPRERIVRDGPRRLATTELVAVLLGSGNSRASAHEIADRLLRRHGVTRLSRLSHADLSAEAGIGTARACQLQAAIELGRRVHERGHRPRAPVVTSPEQAWRLLRPLAAARKEHLVALYLDGRNRLLGRETVSIGTLNTTRTHPRELLHPAIRLLAIGFVIAHNHPGGDPTPSREDVAFTEHIRQAADLIGIQLYDHLVVAADGYVSLKEEGYL